VTTDRAVRRLRQQPVGAYKAPKIRYTCLLCEKRGKLFRSYTLAVAWAHSQSHGPWPLEGSKGNDYVLRVSAFAASNGRHSR
jgi:hypothetical protein